MPRIGTVYLVGAGPGSVDLLTLRAYRLLRSADVVVHDRLVTDEVLALAREDAPRLDVGKAPGRPCLPQEAINALLVRLAREGRMVVRLKGGDPFIFGRGGEEAATLAEARVPFEVVPGVTAALACAAQARIPLTLRSVARAVTLAAGHTADGEIDLDFDALARRGTTLAIYMGAATLPRLRAGLLAHGMPHDTPAALIERGGTPRQRVLHGTLHSVTEDAPDWVTEGPVLAVIGEVVAVARESAGAGVEAMKAEY